MRAVLLATRPGRALAPLSDRTCVALLPVVAKPILVHAVEALAMAGIRDVDVVVSPHAGAVEHALRDGARWGMRCEYIPARPDETADQVVARLRVRHAETLVVVRGDVLRSPCIAEFLARAGDPGDTVIGATIGGVPAGVWLVARDAREPFGLLDDPEDPARWQARGASVELSGAKLSLLETFAAYHRANVEAAAGAYPGLIAPARERAPGVLVGRQSRVPNDCVRGTPVFVGSRCDVKAGAELLGGVVLADDVVVDRRASLRSAVVLPHTYIGELVDVTEAIVWTNDLIHLDSGVATRVTDTFLLADLRAVTLGLSVAGLLHRLLGAVVLVVSLPLWLVMLVVARGGDAAGRLRAVELVGNRMEPGDDGRLRRRVFRTHEAGTSVPVLRHLPKLLAVVRGDLRLVGVSALTPEQDAGRTEEWERVRDTAPVGLLGPAQLELPADAPDEERWVAEAYYAQTRSTQRDVVWLLRGVRALFTGRAWRPGPPNE